MKSAMWQDTESTRTNQWLFCSPQVNIEKEVMDILTFTTAFKKIKISRNKHSQEGKEPLQQKPEVTEERDKDIA